MSSLTQGQRKLEQDIKAKIVDGYRRGVCDSEGHTLEGSRRGNAGKGSMFRKRNLRAWYENFDKIQWSHT